MLSGKDTWKFDYSGDVTASKILAPYALLQASILKEHAGLGLAGEIKSTQRTLRLGTTGGYIKVVKTFNHYDIFIFVPETSIIDALAEEEIEETVQILLTDYELARAYNYYKDTLHLALIASDNVSTASLKPLYNGRCQLDDATYMMLRKVWFSSVIGNTRGYLGGINAYEMGVYNAGSTIYGRIGSDAGALTVIPDVVVDGFSVAYGGTFGIAAQKLGDAWNQFRGIILYALNPANKVLIDAWYWTPSFFTVEIADVSGLYPGFYYGDYPNSRYGVELEDVLVSAKVSFKCLLDRRYAGGSYQYGWAEIVTEINGEDKQDLYVYLQEMPLTLVTNDNYSHVAQYGAAASVNVGASLKGFSASFVLALSVIDPTITMWNFETFGGSSNFCISIVRGASAAFWRAGTLVFETTTYHSHSVSRDGTILAVFEGESTIQNVSVFDLFGKRVPVFGAEYTSTAITELRVSDVVSRVGALTGCIIPYRAEGFVPLELPYELNSSAASHYTGSDYTDYLSSLAWLSFIVTSAGGLLIRKITCDNGVDAEFEITHDECFDSSVVIDDPLIRFDTDKLIGSWNAGGSVRGLVRGSFSGSGDTRRFEGIGNGDMLVVTSPTVLGLSVDALGYIHASGGNDILIPGSCMLDVGTAFIVDPECCPGDTVTASTSCGQSGSFDIPDAAPVTCSGPEDCTVGDVYVGGGGVPPYTYSFGGGTIDPDTGEILSITACSGPAADRFAEVTATALGCSGGSGSIEVRLPGGVWVETSRPQSSCWVPAAENFNCVIISGGSKTEQHGFTASLAQPGNCPPDCSYPPFGGKYMVLYTVNYSWQCP